jgi:hypothetical protein
MNGHSNNSLITHANSSALTAPDPANRAAANLLALMRADREVQNRHRNAQAIIDLEATEELERGRRRKRRPDPTDDKINEAFKRATSCRPTAHRSEGYGPENDHPTSPI